MSTHTEDIQQNKRFAFGRNWLNYATKIDNSRIQEAQESLMTNLPSSLEGKRFLDIGCGSGLFSLAARNMGAKVTSFDYDPDSVHCTQQLKDKHHPDDEDWVIMQGSTLDSDFLKGLGTFDIVYSWGVLHHTGGMWKAINNATSRVKKEGLFFISIYNDQGGYSDLWKAIKRIYVKSPSFVQLVMCLCTFAFFEGRSLLIQLVRLRNPITWWKSRSQGRGMDHWYNVVDWVGGYPFEVAKPEEIFHFLKERKYEMLHFTTNRGGIACNEYVFKNKNVS